MPFFGIMVIPREVWMKHGPTNTRALKEKKATLNLSQIQKQFLVGTLLGDGCLILSRSGKAARLQVRQNVRYEEFVNWKYQFFTDWVLTQPRYDRFNDSLVFRTVSHIQLGEIRNMFYVGTKKIVPNNIFEILTHPLSLAIWFMDDGNGDKRVCRLRLSTYAFGLKGNQKLRKCLLQNFSLETKIIKDSKGSYLYFLEDSAKRLYTMIKPYIIPCMEYKFVKVASITP